MIGSANCWLLPCRAAGVSEIGYRQRSRSEISTPLGTGERLSAGRVVVRASSPALLDNVKKHGGQCAADIRTYREWQCLSNKSIIVMP